MKTAAKKKPKAPQPKPTAIQAIRRQLWLEFLTRGRVVVIGLGGIGLILTRYLVLFLSSLKDEEFRIVLCDGDAYEPDNSYRMDIPDFDNKATAVAQQLSQTFGREGLHVRWVPSYVTAKNVHEVVRDGDCVLLCVDNHATRKLVGDHCKKLRDVVLISGGNDGVEEGLEGCYGNVQVYARAKGKDLNPPLDLYHPEIAQPGDRNPAELDCLEAAAGGAPQILFVNLAVASAMANALWRLMKRGRPMYDEACLDIFEGVSAPHYLGTPDAAPKRNGKPRGTPKQSHDR